MLAHAQTVRNLRYPIASFNNLDHIVSLELMTGAAFEQLSLLASKSGKKAPTNLGVIQTSELQTLN
jgi:hypothetical protein